jgi:RHH-type proline utilization regulon transcriptional repressor/proline dehydrogenase/delta 1-pyrroline-5-carboxylate dehydrogenase
MSAERDGLLAEARAQLAGLRGRAGVDVAAESLALAARIQRLSLLSSTRDEQKHAARMERMVADAPGRALTAAMTDQVFRSRDAGRVASVLQDLVATYGVPGYFTGTERRLLGLFRSVGVHLPRLSVPAVRAQVVREARQVVLPGEDAALTERLRAMVAAGARVNLNHLGEAIVGEAEAARRLQTIAANIARPEVTSVSVKISAICSQIELLAFDQTLALLAERLGSLVRAAQARPNPPLVYLDMEEYRDLHLTVALFLRVLDTPEFLNASAGIVLQAYLPDAFAVQQTLLAWARARVACGGVPPRLRLVKGANLAMEQVDASHHGWPQAPFPAKTLVDANFKRMVALGTQPENAAALRLGIATHNVFDLAHGLILRALHGTEDHVGFEMLEGMAEPTRRVVQLLANDLLVYAPAVAADEMQSAIAYLIRRFDENSGPENFLGRCAAAPQNSQAWTDESARFSASLAAAATLDSHPRRTQDRRVVTPPPEIGGPFANEPDTDWSLPHNRAWIHDELARWQASTSTTPLGVPLVIANETLAKGPAGTRPGTDPSRPGAPLYQTALADEALVSHALDAARAAAPRWSALGLPARARLLAAAAQGLRAARGPLICAMLVDAAKAIPEGDREVSEAIDFAEYYLRSLSNHLASAELTAAPLGVVVVTPPWNFPLAIAAGGVFAALAAGNATILKPAPETALVAHHLAEILWAAGVPRDVLQLIHCHDEPVGTALIADPRVDAVILTGASATARKFAALAPTRPLFAETGGKNAIIVSALADRDLAIKHALASAFGHAGQKCSAASLLIAEAEVYDDPSFRARLTDAAASLHVGSAHDPRSVVTPLIHPPEGPLLRGLTQLDPGESWLLQPRQDPENPALWSPGIKIGVEPGSFTHQTELFGPVLAVMRARDLDHAIELANATPYGLTSGLSSLDVREHTRWLAAIDAGNCYINRTITGAIVQRQPFGGRKASSFGYGTKAGGPDYVLQFCHLRDATPPRDLETPPPELRLLLEAMKNLLEPPARPSLERAAASYAHAYDHWFSQPHDPARLVGQDNLLLYEPRPGVLLRVEQNATAEDLGRAFLAAATARTEAKTSVDPAHPLAASLGAPTTVPGLAFETAEALIARLSSETRYLRVLGTVPTPLAARAAALEITLDPRPPLALGRIELTRWLQEQSVSSDYHRYGNLGLTEDDERTPVL